MCGSACQFSLITANRLVGAAPSTTLSFGNKNQVSGQFIANYKWLVREQSAAYNDILKINSHLSPRAVEKLDLSFADKDNSVSNGKKCKLR